MHAFIRYIMLDIQCVELERMLLTMHNKSNHKYAFYQRKYVEAYEQRMLALHRYMMQRDDDMHVAMVG